MNLRSVYRLPLSSKGSEREILKDLTALGAAFGLSSCNVTRTVTTKSEYWQRGDTSAVIQTRTVETYDASRKL